MSNQKLYHYQLRISGRVQGVYYRASFRERAAALGVHGIVRNEADGSVYAEIESTDAEALQQLIEWARRGPARAQVAEVQVTEAEHRQYSDFRVER